MALLWVFFMPILVACGTIGGIVLIIEGIKHRKIFAGVMGLICFLFIAMPFIGWAVGIDLEQDLLISTVTYWSIFSFVALLACLSGIRNQIKSIRNIGFLICLAGILGVVFYQSM
ncbi:ammonia permease [Priestia taiwanensis]|uniref:Ammonia permease n=1 Tax=Priestia taiwanensis TaxID=1347902 RepID=A0A917EP68_9BACI|nr:ammonia permease [Priestia taiwanensis]MBM7362372.1 hypothetical protein [Priestia taiwanensis]GGE61639.1 hypothetical protein GCM10007140_09960 [Priestia taiwanensis]